MKIDPRTLLPADQQATSVKNSRNASSASSKQTSGLQPANGEDTVKISTAHGDLQALKAGLEKVPEIRANRVNALQQRVRSGQYQPDSHKIADAIIAEQSRAPKKS